MKKPTLTAVLLTSLFTASALFAYEAGGFAYTKRVETKLLAEPRPMAEVTGKLAYGQKLQVEEVKGPWLRVSDGPTSGWVFSGNLSETKLAEVKGLDDLGLSASKTTATAAARPLDDAAMKYASSQQNLASAQEDLAWMINACSAVTHEEVETYLETNKKGEYQ